jgi:CubicO group peptidase (beta-lactamase class C family)
LSVRTFRRSFAIAGLAAAAALVSALPVRAAEPSAAGRWEGSIELPGTHLAVQIELAGGAGAWKGSIDIPAQNAKGLALEEITAGGLSVSFAISGVPGHPAFKGTLAPDGASISGDFTQGGATFPFKLARAGDPGEKAAAALKGFGDFVTGALKDWKVPGCAVAVVSGDRVVLAEGYGLRDVKKNLPVTRDTLFAIGSSTKAFTVMTLGLLADEGKLSWDAPVKQYLPTFKLKDPTASDHMTPRDLVTHRSGLPRHDLMWYNAPLSRKELFDRLQYIEPNADFRAKWQYQNLMFMTAGYLAGEVAGASWEDLVRARIFGPLGMTSSNFSVEDSRKAADFSLPYDEKDKQVIEIPFRNITTVGPAGSINSNVVDMAQWVMLHVNGGRAGGKRLVNENTISEMHRPQMVMPERGFDPEIVLTSYAMGWFVESYRGKVRIHHGGNIDGFSAMVTFLPKENVGVVVLSNHGGSPLSEVVARTAIDRLLGFEPIDWNARVLARARAAEKAGDKAKEKMDLDRKKGTKPAHAQEEYAGDYDHPAYGTLAISKDAAGNLKALIHSIPMRLEHWHYETFRGYGEDPALSELKLFFLFETNTKGDVDRVLVPLEPQAPEIVFTKKPPARLFDAGFLKGLAGSYVFTDDAAVTVTVTLKGENALTVSIPNQPVYDLEPYRGTEFRMRGLTGFSIRFVLDAAGTARELLILQPDGVYSARRKVPAG